MLSKPNQYYQILSNCSDHAICVVSEFCGHSHHADPHFVVEHVLSVIIKPVWIIQQGIEGDIHALQCENYNIFKMADILEK